MSKPISQFLVAFLFVSLVTLIKGLNGFIGPSIDQSPVLFICFYTLIISHLTIVAMSLSFHRYHAHKSVILNKRMDALMQVWLWLITSLNRIDWVAVHIYHHAHSDKTKDPHSPVQKGIWHVFFMGAVDYNKGKSIPEVEKIKKSIKKNSLEAFIQRNSLLGPTIMTTMMLILLGPLWGAVLSVINFTVSPLLAVGGVNAMAHWWGYRNHSTHDNSRNLGFLFPLNFIVCGELDHNNHHAHSHSCSFRNRWFEFDIGYVYLTVLKWLKLAEIKSVYGPINFRRDRELTA